VTNGTPSPDVILHHVNLLRRPRRISGTLPYCFSHRYADHPNIRTDSTTLVLARFRANLKKKVNVVLGGPHCIVGKAMLAGRVDVSEKVLLKLDSIFHTKLYVSLVCESWSKKWQSIVKVEYMMAPMTPCSLQIGSRPTKHGICRQRTF